MNEVNGKREKKSCKHIDGMIEQEGNRIKNK